MKDAVKLKASFSSDREVILHFLPDSRPTAKRDMRMPPRTQLEEK